MTHIHNVRTDIMAQRSFSPKMHPTPERPKIMKKWASVSSNDEKSCIFINYNVFLAQSKRFESKISSDFEKRRILGVLVKNVANCEFSFKKMDFWTFFKLLVLWVAMRFFIDLDSLKSYKCEFSENICFGTFRHIFGYFSANFRGTFCGHSKSVVISANFAEK